jgi:hypothetical protein
MPIFFELITRSFSDVLCKHHLQAHLIVLPR